MNTEKEEEERRKHKTPFGLCCGGTWTETAPMLKPGQGQGVHVLGQGTTSKVCVAILSLKKEK